MSFYPLALAIDTTSGVPDTGYTDLNLRISPYSSRAYTMTAGANGVYYFGTSGDPIVSGEYKVFNVDTELTAFGILKIGEDGAVLVTGNQTIVGVKTFSNEAVFSAGLKSNTISENTSDTGVTIDGILLKDSLDTSGIVSKTGSQTLSNKTLAGATLTNTLDANNNNIINLPAPTIPTHPLRQTDGDTRYVRKETGIVNFIYSRLIHYINPTIINDATQLTEAVNWGQVKRLVDASIVSFAGSVTAYQTTLNMLRVVPTGTQEDNKIYTTITGAKSIAEMDADSDRLYYIELQGNGVDGSFTNANYNLLPAGSLNAYVHYAGLNKAVIIRMEDSTYTGASSSIRVRISNCTIDFDGATSTPVMENIIFNNVNFTNPGNTSAVTFNNCHFENSCEYDSTITPTYNASTTGQIYNSTSKRFIFIDPIYDKSNTYEVLSTAGDLRGRRILGRKANSVASSSSITIGNGNYCVVTGTTTILTINTTGWTDGSIIYLYHSGACLIDTGGGNIAAVGGDFTTVAGTVYCYVLDSSTWIRVF